MKLKMLTRSLLNNPRMHYENVKLHEAGSPLPILVDWARAAVHYALCAQHVFQNREDLYKFRHESRFRLQEVRQRRGRG